MVTIFGGWTEVDEEIEEVDTCGSGDGVTTGAIEEVANVLGELDMLRRCCVEMFCHFWWLNAYCVCVILTGAVEIFMAQTLNFRTYNGSSVTVVNKSGKKTLEGIKLVIVSILGVGD
jgi:hypothetical protein